MQLPPSLLEEGTKPLPAPLELALRKLRDLEPTEPGIGELPVWVDGYAGGYN